MSNQHTHHDINNKGDLNISVDLKYHTLVDGLALGVVYLSKDLKVIDKNHLIDYWFPVDSKDTLFCYESLDLNKRAEQCEDSRVLDVFETGYSNESIRVKKTAIGLRTFKIIARPIKDENNQVVAVMETLEDITDLLESQRIKDESQKQLLESNLRFSQLSMQSKSVTWEVDAHGIFTYISDNVETEWGYRKEDLIGKKYFHDLNPTDIRDKYKNEIQEKLNEGESFTGLENPILTKSGDIKWVISAGVAKRDKSGNIIGLKCIDTDVTKQKETEHQLIRNRKFLSNMLEYSGTLVYLKNLEGTYLFVNKKWEEITKRNRDETIGKKDYEIFSSEIARKFVENDRRVMEEKKVMEFEEHLDYEDNTFYFLSIKFPIFDENDQLTSICGITTDITERKMAEEKILYLATHDYLTGLPTTQVIKDRMKVAIELAKRNSTNFSVLLIDLDGFKSVNDTYGHDAGDKVLVTVAQRIEETIRKSDTASRIAGDEFMVLLMETSDENALNTLVSRIKDRINEPIDVNGGVISVSSSIGVATYPLHGQSIDELVRYSDRMMYMDKRGR